MNNPTSYSLLELKKQFFDAIGYAPVPEVMAFHASEAAVRICFCPRQSGKSYAAAREAAFDLLQPNRLWWVVGPTYASASREFGYVADVLVRQRDKLGLPKYVKFSENVKNGDLYIKFPWGSEVVGKSCEKPSLLQGFSLDGLIFSETALEFNPHIWYRYLEPTLRVRRGKAIFPTTPDAKALWLTELYQRGLSGQYPDIASFNWPVTANPLYPLEEFERAKQQFGETHPYFQEQYLGMCVFYTGRPYATFQRESHVIEPFPIPKEWRRVRAIDFGHRDPFVSLYGAAGPDGEIYIYREYYLEGESTAVHAANIKEVEKGERIYSSVADPSAAQLIADLRSLGIHCAGAITDRKAGRERVCRYLLPAKGFRPQTGVRLDYWERQDRGYPKLFIFSSCKELIRELLFLRWESSKDIEGAKEKTLGDDHATDALRYLLMSCPTPFKEESKLPRYSGAWFAQKEEQTRLARNLIGGH